MVLLTFRAQGTSEARLCDDTTVCRAGGWWRGSSPCWGPRLSACPFITRTLWRAASL